MCSLCPSLFSSAQMHIGERQKAKQAMIQLLQCLNQPLSLSQLPALYQRGLCLSSLSLLICIIIFCKSSRRPSLFLSRLFLGRVVEDQIEREAHIFVYIVFCQQPIIYMRENFTQREKRCVPPKSSEAGYTSFAPPNSK